MVGLAEEDLMQKQALIIASCVGAALFGAVIASAAPKKGAAPMRIGTRRHSLSFDVAGRVRGERFRHFLSNSGSLRR